MNAARGPQHSDLALQTPAMQDYLKAIYRLQANSALVSTQRIAAQLGVAPPSVTSMVKRLHNRGFVYHANYHGVQLTVSGEQIAVEVIRHHRLLECYLVEKLGYGPDEVHAEAEQLEHYLSEELEAHIDAALGHPTFDPHGDPIPGPERVVAIPADYPLTSLAVGVAGSVVRVRNADPLKLRYLADLGVLPERSVTVLEVLPFHGPLRVRLGAAEDGADTFECLLSRELAAAVLVQTLTDQERHPSPAGET